MLLCGMRRQLLILYSKAQSAKRERDFLSEFIETSSLGSNLRIVLIRHICV